MGMGDRKPMDLDLDRGLELSSLADFLRKIAHDGLSPLGLGGSVGIRSNDIGCGINAEELQSWELEVLLGVGDKGGVKVGVRR